MTNKTTKRALLSSVFALVLCFTMLLGTTFAWFTDSVTSGSNVIQTGNLDVEVEYTLDGKTWKKLDGANDIFQKGLWEPGHTEVVALKIMNTGTLSLKYTAQMNLISEVVGKSKAGDDIVLSDILTVSTLTQQANDAMGIGDITLMLAFAGENKVAYQKTASFKDTNILGRDVEVLHPGDSHYVFVKVDMADTVTNEANHDGVNVPSIEFGMNVFATQYNAESDTFGNGYDATTPILVTNAAEAQAALDNAVPGTTIQLMPGVHYGTLEVRVNVGLDGNTPVAAHENTEAVDYLLAKSAPEFVRNLKDVTIIGASGATVDAIKFVTQGFKLTIPETGRTTQTIQPFISVENFLIDSVEFTDDSTVTPDAQRYSPLVVDLSTVKVDGFTVQNCKLEGDNSKMNFFYAYIGSPKADFDFPVLMKNLTLANNTVSGIARFVELRASENVTIVGNVAKNLTAEFAQLGHNAKYDNAYAGSIVFEDNTAENIPGQFAVIAKTGDANVEIRNNVITNVCAEYPDFVFDIRALNDGNTPTIESNTVNN